MSTDTAKPDNAANEELTGMRDNADRVRCVFSNTGDEARRYWFVNQTEEDTYALFPLNENNVPMEEQESTITTDDLLAGYVPEVEYFETVMLKAVAKLEHHLNTGEKEREEGKLYSAEHSFEKALDMDENNVRALFNLGLIYLERNDQEKAVELMDQLLDFRATFKGKNQHLFNEFGIALRKAGLLNEAAAYFAQALEYVKTDEHLYYNYARINYERGNWEACVQGISRASAINPDLVVAQKLITLLKALAADEKLLEKYGKPPIPSSLVPRIEELVIVRPRPEDKPTVSEDDLALDENFELDDVVSSERGRVRSGGTDENTPRHSFDLD